MSLLKKDKMSLSKQTGRDDVNGNTVVIDKGGHALNDEIIEKVVDHFLDKENINTNSRIKPEQVSNLSKLKLADTMFDAPICGLLYDSILQLQVSINGLGRREIVQMIQQRSEGMSPETMLTSGKIFR